jgi:hypothetical protein
LLLIEALVVAAWADHLPLSPLHLPAVMLSDVFAHLGLNPQELDKQIEHWIHLSRQSARLEQQAALPRGHREVFQLKIELEKAKPPIWRRVLVSSEMVLRELHLVVQRAMGWDNSHCYNFAVGSTWEDRRCYGNVELMNVDLIQQAMGEFVDDGCVRLDHILTEEKARMCYVYDFGDSWQHRITLEKILAQPVKQAGVPRCIAGRRACPPEDVGGLPGYIYALDVLADPSHPRYAELSAWCGDSFDPAHFDLAAADAAVQSVRHARSRHLHA